MLEGHACRRQTLASREVFSHVLTRLLTPPCSFKTIFNPQAVDDYAQRNRRSNGSGGAPPKPGGPRGPRVTGLGDLRDAGGNAACGGGG